MSKSFKPRLRSFENASNQRHIQDKDRFLYKKKNEDPEYRLTIIGVGTMGQEHMFVSTLLGKAKIHGIYDKEKYSMDIAESEFKSYASYDIIRYNDLESACNDPNTDAIMICTPNYTHLSVLKIAVKSGKPIFVEKPMATTLADAAEIFHMSDHYKSFIQIGLQYRFKCQYKEAYHELLNRKVIGDIQTISMSEYRPPFLDKVDQWNKFSKNTGGTLVEKCCHYFDLMNLFAGSIPKKIYATCGKSGVFLDFKHNNKSSDIDDYAFVIIEYDNDIKANFTLNMFSPDFNEELIVSGAEGRLIASEKFSFKNNDSSETTFSIQLGENGSSRESNISYPSSIEKSGHHGATFYEHVELIKLLKGEKSNSATPTEGLWSIIIATAAQESMKSGKPVIIEDYLKKYNLLQVLNL